RDEQREGDAERDEQAAPAARRRRRGEGIRGGGIGNGAVSLPPAAYAIPAPALSPRRSAALEWAHAPTEARAQRGEPGVEVGAAGAAEVRDRVAVARAVLVLLEVAELLADRALRPDERVGERGLGGGDLGGAGRGEHAALLEDAQREARGGGV